MVTYEYKGLLVRVPDSVKFIAIGPDGVVRGYTSRPDLSNPDSLMQSSDAIKVMLVNYTDMLTEVSELKKYEPIVVYETAAPNSKPYEVGDTLTLLTKIDEEQARISEVHVVVNCYTPGLKPWTQILQVKVNGLSIDNIILSTVTDVLFEYSPS